MSFKYRTLQKGFSRGVRASRMISYTDPNRNPLGKGPPSANPRWSPSHRLAGYFQLGSTLSAATVERPLVSVLISAVWNFVWNSDQNIHSFPPRKRRNFEILNFVDTPYCSSKRTSLKMFAFWYFNLIAEPYRFPNQSRRLPFALALDSW